MLLGTLVISGWCALLTFLWNRLVPTLFDGPTIVWWQALSLLVMVKLLTGGWRRAARLRRRRAWRRKFANQWHRMTPEERARFEQHFARCCGQWGCADLGREPSEQVEEVRVG